MGSLILAERRSRLEAAIAAAIDALDLLDGDAEMEPLLGAPEPTTAGNLDQRRWAQGGDNSEREIFTGDDEPDQWHEVGDYPLDQRVVIMATGQAVDVSGGAC